MELPKRKPNRLEGYDYSQNGAYFITICAKDNRHIFWDNNATDCRGELCSSVRPKLSDIGVIVDNEINSLSTIYSTVAIDKYVVMPNHIHMIIILQKYDDGRAQLAPTVSRIVQQFKGSITKKIGYSIWQKLFHDRIIRNNKEYETIWQYIDTNPQTWVEDDNYI